MDLNKLQFKANLRTGWQALDLGYLMARRWWPTLMLSSAIPALLLFLPLLLVFFDHPYWAVFIIWWLKPFWERLPLYYASRKIFSEDTGLRDMFRQIFSLYLKDFIPWLVWRRFAFQRSYDAPVTLLEGLKGSARSKRLQTLHGKYTDTAISNQLVGLIFEAIVSGGIFFGLALLLPDAWSEQFFDSFDDETLLGEWVYSLCMFMAMFCVLPFYTMAGFSLYLNRRIELEAWDIEISFRSLAERKQSRGSSLGILLPAFSALLLTLVLVSPQPALAQIQHDASSARDLIDSVLDGEDYGSEKTVSKWRFKNLVEENEDKIPQWFIDFIRWLEQFLDFDVDEDTGDMSLSFSDWVKLLLIAAFVALVVYLLYRYRVPLSGLANRNREGEAERPDVLFGLDVTPESIPKNVTDQVMQLWQQQQHREALGLLYRAALSHLIEHHDMAFKASHTEAECAALVKRQGIQSLSNYFSQLTHVWRHLAYGHELPEQSVLEQLCKQWSKEMKHAQT